MEFQLDLMLVQNLNNSNESNQPSQEVDCF